MNSEFFKRNILDSHREKNNLAINPYEYYNGHALSSH